MMSLSLYVLILIFTVLQAQIQIKPDINDALLADALHNIIELQCPECPLAVGTDYSNLSTPLQHLLKRTQTQYLSVVMSMMMDSFPYDPADYPWTWKPEHLLSFRTQPPELRSKFWPGTTSSFNIILSTTASNVPHLIMHTASSFMIRNLYDPVFIHVHQTGAETLLLQDPAQGIRMKMLSSYDQTRLLLHTVCYFCNNGQHVLNNPIVYDSSKSLERRDVLAAPGRYRNGRVVVLGYVNDIDVEDAETRERNGDLLVYAESALLDLQRRYDIKVVIKVPELTTKELHPNGSLTGLSNAVVSRQCEVMLVTIYTEVSNRAVMLGYPVWYLQAGIVTRIPHDDMKWYLIFQPFSLIVWITLLGSIVVSSITLYYLNTVSDCKSYPIHMYIQHLLREIIYQPLSPLLNTNPILVFHVFCSLLAIVISCAYQTKLVQLITFPRPEVLPVTVSDLYKSTWTWGTTLLMSVMFSLAAENIDSNHIIQDLLKNVQIIPTIEECFEKTLLEDFACIVPNFVYDQNRDYYLDDRGNPRTKFWGQEGFSLYTGVSYGRDDINFVREDKDMQRIFEAHIPKARESRVNTMLFLRKVLSISRKNTQVGHKEKEKILSFSKLANIFFILLIGYMMSIVALVYETLKHSWKNH